MLFLARGAAACVFLLFKVNFIVVFVDHAILKIVERLVGLDSELASKLPALVEILADESLLEIGIDKWVYIHNKVAHLE